jgi:hypothetical protein
LACSSLPRPLRTKFRYWFTVLLVDYS